MKPSEMLKLHSRGTVDWTQRVIGALSEGPRSQTALRVMIGMTNAKQVHAWGGFLDDLAERGIIKVWREEVRHGPGRPAVMVALADPPSLTPSPPGDTLPL